MKLRTSKHVLVLLGNLLVGCREPVVHAQSSDGPLPHDAQTAAEGSDGALLPDATTYRAVPMATIPVADSYFSVPPPISSGVSVDAWLHEHGVERWDHDAACWVRSSGIGAPGAWRNECRCKQAISLETTPPRDLLVCERPLETRSPSVPWMTHTLVYAASRGRVHAVLDVPTAAASDSETVSFSVPNVQLVVRSLGTNLEIADYGAVSGHPCSASVALASSNKMDDVARAYESVCESIGTWRWSGTGLLRLPL